MMTTISTFNYRGIECGIEQDNLSDSTDFYFFYYNNEGKYKLMSLPSRSGIKEMQNWIDNNLF